MHTQDIKSERTILYGRNEISTKINRQQFFIEHNKESNFTVFIDTLADFYQIRDDEIILNYQCVNHNK